jgi:hypothetical protein
MRQVPMSCRYAATAVEAVREISATAVESMQSRRRAQMLFLLSIAAFWSQAHAQSQTCPKRTDYHGVHLYDASCSTYRDLWGTNGADHVLSANAWGTPISVTSAMTLAGAIASVKVAGYEYIASGGHGAAFQWAFHHDAPNSPALDECKNPTQAGTRSDGGDRGPFQYHGPSTSAVLWRPAASTTRSVTASRLAMWLKNGERSDYNPCVASYPAGSVAATYALSEMWLENTIQMAPGPYFADLPNVFSVEASLTTTLASRRFDGFLIAYLRREFTRLYNYDPSGKRLVHYAGPASAYPVAACNDNGYCMALYFTPYDFQTGFDSPAGEPLYYYASKQEPGSGGYGEVTLIQVSIKPKTISSQRPERYKIYAVLGNQAVVEDSLCIMRARDRLRSSLVFACARP